MRRFRQEAELHERSQLIVRDAGGRPFDIAPGDGRVLLVMRRHAGRFLTHDTGLVEELYVDLGQQADGPAITSWRAAGYQCGTLRQTYLSTDATGSLALRRETRRRLLRPDKVVYAGSAGLIFDRPRIDDRKVGQAKIDWSFEAKSG